MKNAKQRKIKSGEDFGGMVLLVVLIVIGIWGFHKLQSRNNHKLFFTGSSTVLACKRPFIDSSKCAYISAHETNGQVDSLGSLYPIPGTMSCDITLSKNDPKKVRACSFNVSNGSAYDIWDIYPGNIPKSALDS